MPPGKGSGIKAKDSRSNALDVEYEFGIYSLTNEGEEITRVETSIGGTTSYKYIDAVQDFELLGETENPITLDLTARHLQAGTRLNHLGQDINAIYAAEGGGTFPIIPFDKDLSIDQKIGSDEDEVDNHTFLYGVDYDEEGQEEQNVHLDDFFLHEDIIEYTIHSTELESLGINGLTFFISESDLESLGIDDPNIEGIDDPSAYISNLDSVINGFNFLSGVSLNEQNNIDGTEGITYNIVGLNSPSFAEIKTETLTIEAEDIVLNDPDTFNYFVIDYGETGQVASLRNQDGTELSNNGGFFLKFGDYGLTDGEYDLSFSYFDENDGEGEIYVEVISAGGELYYAETLVLNEETSSGYPTEETRREFTIEDINIDEDSFVRFEGFADEDEWARIDYITLERESIIIQAEDLYLSNYQVEDYEGTEKVISLLNASDTTGTATLYAYDYGFEGLYDIGISYFDENDGEAEITLEVTNVSGVVVDSHTLLLDENTSSGYPTEETRQQEIVLEDVSIGSGSTVTITGIAEGSEWARVDYLSFYEDTIDEFVEI